MRPALALLVGLAAAGVPRSEYARNRKASFLRGPVEVLEPYKDGGLAAPQHHLNKAISPKEWETALQGVVASGESRFVFAKSMPKVRKYLRTQLGETVKEEKFPLSVMQGQGDGFNLVAHVPGEHATFVVVAAHYDTVPATGPAPGAEDNGSGVASVLEVAKKIREAGKPKHSIYFVLFSAEEEGLYGSTAFAKHLVETGEQADLQGAIILDEVAFTRTKSESVIFETSGKKDANQRIIDTLAAASKTVSPNIDFQVNYAGFGSDHMPFLERGMPAVLVIERDNLFYADNFAHTAKDTIQNTTPQFGADIATLVAEAAWDLANA